MQFTPDGRTPGMFIRRQGECYYINNNGAGGMFFYYYGEELVQDLNANKAVKKRLIVTAVGGPGKGEVCCTDAINLQILLQLNRRIYSEA
uniref:Phage protein n=1 Tax=Syphacia muris TaxID=451379 RepID=A0A0N5AZB1_9BILA